MPKNKNKNIRLIDKIIHEPVRLVILLFLARNNTVDYRELKVVTGFTWGNLSAHLSKLEKSKYIEISKYFENKFPRTKITITENGKKGLKKYRLQIKKLVS